MKNIKIPESKTADTHSAETLVDKQTLLKSSKQHIKDVQNILSNMSEELKECGSRHDYTKIENIDEFYKYFKAQREGSKKDFKKENWFSKYHLKERHHLTDRCPDDVNLFDVLERIADIVAAGMARTGKFYDDELDSDILQKAYKNTIELVKDSITVYKERTV